jgi:hypothetical protein
MKRINKKHMAVLKRIQASIPEELLAKVVYKEKVSDGVVGEIITKGLADPEVSAEVKEKLMLMKESGFLDKEVEVENLEVTKEIDAYIDSEMEKAIKRGELPAKKQKNGRSKKRVN